MQLQCWIGCKLNRVNSRYLLALSLQRSRKSLKSANGAASPQKRIYQMTSQEGNHCPSSLLLGSGPRALQSYVSFQNTGQLSLLAMWQTTEGCMKDCFVAKWRLLTPPLKSHPGRNLKRRLIIAAPSKTPNERRPLSSQLSVKAAQRATWYPQQKPCIQIAVWVPSHLSRTPLLDSRGLACVWDEHKTWIVTRYTLLCYRLTILKAMPDGAVL